MNSDIPCNALISVSVDNGCYALCINTLPNDNLQGLIIVSKLFQHKQFLAC